MHVLFVHQNFPAQFGHIASRLVKDSGWKCTFVSETPAGIVEGIEKIQYKLLGGARRETHYCSRSFENAVWHADAVYRAVRSRPDLNPDLIVGHSGFGSTLFLKELFPDTPLINFFEYYYRAHDPDSDMDFRTDLGWVVPEIKYLRSRARNAMILLDLQNCDVAYTPTRFQQSRFPEEYKPKLRVIFDGIDRAIYHGHDDTLRRPLSERQDRVLAGVPVSAQTRVVTYVSRGFESMRGFDVFMRSAKLIYQQFPDVRFIVVGTDRIAYGGDDQHTGGKSFKDWVLAQDDYDLSRFSFVGRLPAVELGKLLAASDLHIYVTVPFVLSWSMMDAMSCGAVVLASATSPVREMIEDGRTGLLADFFKPEEFAEKALGVLESPDRYREIGRAAEREIVDHYSLDAVLPRMLEMYDDAVRIAGARPRSTQKPVDRSRPLAAGEEQVPIARIIPVDSRNQQIGKGFSPFRG